MRKLISLQDELKSITVSLSLFGFANALVGVFIPLIILKSGAPIREVCGFYVTYAFVKLILNYPVVQIIQRFGAHIGLGIGFVAGAIQMVSILQYSSSKSAIFLLLGAASLALANACLWNSQHIYISRVMNSATKSSSIATMEIVNQILNVLAPLAGGFIGIVGGVNWLLAAALMIALTALIPLRHVGKLNSEHNGNEHSKVQYNLKGAPPRDLVANFCFNIETSVGVMVWPIYLAVIIGTFKGIGLITALAAGVTVIVVWIAGQRGDKGRDRSVLRQGATVSSTTHLLRLFATTSLSIALVSACYKASLAYLQNAWVSNYYSHAKVKGIPYVMSMEIACDIAYAVLWSILFAVSILGNERMIFTAAFILAAIAAWGCLLITKQGERLQE